MDIKDTCFIICILFAVIACKQEGRLRDVKIDSNNTFPNSLVIDTASIQIGSYSPHIYLSNHPEEEKPSDSLQKILQRDVTQEQLDKICKKEHIVYFWSSWCKDCKETQPGIFELQHSFKQMQWITVSLDTDAQAARAYAKSNALRGIHIIDGKVWEGETCKLFGIPQCGIPYIYYIGEDGKVKWKGHEPQKLKQFLENAKETACKPTL
jgi:thiol-disulfide isomerase/thioredoxin